MYKSSLLFSPAFWSFVLHFYTLKHLLHFCSWHFFTFSPAPPPPPPPLIGGQPYACSMQILRDTPFKDENGLGFWPHYHGLLEGKPSKLPPYHGLLEGKPAKITPPPYHWFLEGKLAKLPPKWRKSAEVKSVHNFSTCMDRIVWERFENYP